MLCAASVLIAGAGYIINDYFDINIDQVNKPDKMIVDKLISRRAAIFWHWLFSGIGLLLSAYVSFKLRNPFIILGNVLCVVLLWVYSTTYKRRLLAGNVLISLMTAWVILVMLVAEIPGWITFQILEGSEKAAAARITRIGVLYAAFAFVISLVREVVKDIEDIDGDRKENCQTMPIVYGINAAKVFAGTWLFMLVTMLFITQVYVLIFSWWYSAFYIIVFVVIPLIVLFRKLFRATTVVDYHSISTQLKWVMLSGILSMFFFLLYTR
jgi:4-hydroxybenzoate polyprenyltransferase